MRISSSFVFVFCLFFGVAISLSLVGCPDSGRKGNGGNEKKVVDDDENMADEEDGYWSNLFGGGSESTTETTDICSNEFVNDYQKNIQPPCDRAKSDSSKDKDFIDCRGAIVEFLERHGDFNCEVSAPTAEDPERKLTRSSEKLSSVAEGLRKRGF